VLAIGDEDVARFEAWAARQRAELSQLALAVRKAQVRAERAERDVPPELEAPEDLLTALDSMLDTAVRQADLAVQAARRDAAALVAAEHAWATEHLEALGRDPTVELGLSVWSSIAVPDVARPLTATDLWRGVEADARAPEPVLEEELPVEEPEPEFEVEVVDDEDVELVLFDDADLRQPVRPMVPALLGGSPPTPVPRSGDDGELFDDFWNEAGVDVFWGEAESSRRPLRDRLRRRDPHGFR
jgi:hypothetical protein